MILLLLYCHFLLTFGCPTYTTTTSKPVPTSTPIQKTYHWLFTFSHMKYTACMDCRIININLTALVNERYFKLRLPNDKIKYKYMEKVSTWSIKGTFLSTFQFLNEKGSYEEITFLYSDTAVFGTIRYYIKGTKLVIVTIRQLHRLVTIIEEQIKSFKPGSHHYTPISG